MEVSISIVDGAASQPADQRRQVMGLREQKVRLGAEAAAVAALVQAIPEPPWVSDSKPTSLGKNVDTKA